MHLLASLLVLARWPAARPWCGSALRRPPPSRCRRRAHSGNAALERHFPISRSIPEYILIQSPRDLRSPRALADLEQLAARSPSCRRRSGQVASPGPWARSPEFRATYQAGHRRRPTGRRLRPDRPALRPGPAFDGADTLATNLADVRAQINQIAPSIQNLIDAFTTLPVQYGGDALVRDVDAAAKLVDSINACCRTRWA